MAYEDDQLMFSKAQDLTAVAVGTKLSDKSIYMGSAGTVPGFTSAAPINDPGRGSPKRLFCKVVTAFATAAGGTLFVELVMADDEQLATNLKVLNQTPIIAAAQLVAGYEFRLNYLPVGITKKYLGLRYNIGTGVFTAGKLNAGIAESVQENPFVGDQG